MVALLPTCQCTWKEGVLARKYPGRRLESLPSTRFKAPVSHIPGLTLPVSEDRRGSWNAARRYCNSACVQLSLTDNMNCDMASSAFGWKNCFLFQWVDDSAPQLMDKAREWDLNHTVPVMIKRVWWIERYCERVSCGGVVWELGRFSGVL